MNIWTMRILQHSPHDGNFRRSAARPVLPWPVAGLALAGLLFAGAARAETLEVKPGMAIQKVVNRAKAGDTILVHPGVYHEFVYIDQPDITLRGIKKDGNWPVLDGQGKLNDGIIASGTGFHVENFRIMNYKANGVMSQGANDVVMRHLLVENTGIYGIYPTMGTNITIEDTVSVGIADAAIYIGMCTHVDVRRNETYGSVIGIEVENSEHVLVEKNLAYDNSAGIVVFAIPGLPRKRAEDVIIRGNFVYDNNHRNFAEPGALAAGVPPGIGIGVLAGDRVIMEDNIIRRNSFAGIALGDHSLLPITEQQDHEVDPNPDGNRILRNVFLDNGRRTWGDLVSWLLYVVRTVFYGSGRRAEGPDGQKVGLFPKGFDVVASGRGVGNCILDPETVTRVGVGSFGRCASSDTTAKIATMVGARERTLSARSREEIGRQVYATVCASCHSMNMKTIGPPVTEIREKYHGNPYGIVRYASLPHRVRKGYAAMPSQRYLGLEKLNAAAHYMLSRGREGTKPGGKK